MNLLLELLGVLIGTNWSVSHTVSRIGWISQFSRIAQLCIRKVPQVTIEEVDSLSDSDRGTKGFGSTG